MISVGVIQTGLDEFIMVSRKDNQKDFGLVGGKAEKGETPYECLVREVKEETGLTVTHATLIDTRNYGGNDTYCFYINSFVSEGKISDAVKNFNQRSTNEGIVKLGTLSELCDETSSFYDYNLEITNIALGNLFDKTFYRIEEFSDFSEKIECLFESFNQPSESIDFSNVVTGLGEVTYIEYLYNKAKSELIDKVTN